MERDSSIGCIAHDTSNATEPEAGKYHCDAWLDPIPHRRVVLGQLLFGDAVIRPIDPVGMGQAHIGDGVAPLRARRLATLRGCGPPDRRIACPRVAAAAAATGRSRTTSRAGLSSRKPL